MKQSQWITGAHSVEALIAKRESGHLLLEQGNVRADALGASVAGSVRVDYVSRQELRKRTGNPKARFAAFRLESRSGERPETAAGGTPLFDIASLFEPADYDIVVALDQVSDPHNLGAVMRSADRFGVRGLIYPQHGSAPATETVLRSSAGTSAHVHHGAVVNLSRSLKQLKDAGYWIYAADAHGAACWSSTIATPVVLVFGSEGKGIRPGVLSACDGVLSIPGHGFADSLNVSVAAGILMYELRRRGR